MYLLQPYVVSKQNISQMVHQCFVRVAIPLLRLMANKGLMEEIPTNFSDLEKPCSIFIMTKGTKKCGVLQFLSRSFPCIQVSNGFCLL